MKKEVSKRALIARIRRKLHKDSVSFRTNRGGPYSNTLGKYFCVDDRTNSIIVQGVDDLERYGRELNVLDAYEVLVAE